MDAGGGGGGGGSAAPPPRKKRPRLLGRDGGGAEGNDNGAAGGGEGGGGPRVAAGGDVPKPSHYEVSYLHRSTVTRAASSDRHGYVLTGSDDGVVKFWKRVGAGTAAAAAGSGAGSTGDAAGDAPARCLEFVKSYTAHVGPVLALVVSAPHGDSAASVGADGTIKLYDVGTFDVTGMIKTRGSNRRAGGGGGAGGGEVKLGMHAAILGEDQSLVAVSSATTLADVSENDEDDSDDDDGPSLPSEKKEEEGGGGGARGRAAVGAIYVYSTVTLSPDPVRIVRLHAAPVTCLGYNPAARCAVSCDGKGVVELWDASVLGGGGGAGAAGGEGGGNDGEGIGGNAAYDSIGSPPTASRNGVTYSSKFDTSLYDLMRKKTFAVALAICPTGTHFALYGADRKIRILDFGTCKTAVIYDERAKVYDAQVKKRADILATGKGDAGGGMDAIEYGKRAATEREMDDTPIMTGGVESDTILSRESGSQLLSMQFDPTGRFILIPTILGIKVIDWRRNRSVGVVGRADASTLRFLYVCLCSGDARVDKQMQLARTGGSSAAIDHDDLSSKQNKSDALIVALAYKKRRLYVFSHSDPVADAEGAGEDEEAAVLLGRDVMNEPPDADDMLVSGVGGGGAGRGGQPDDRLGSEAILRTTMGDVHIKLYPDATPRTVENFCGHARSGYYDNVIFHRVIKGFMLQTGDPLGDGTGGESIWGGEFEDEFVRELRHDRPFTVSMANAGPGTNGSQFFITTVPTPWLDNKHTVFGRVTKGMDVCSSIESVQTDEMDKPLTEISIMSVDIL